MTLNQHEIASLKSESTCKLINRIPGSRLLITGLPGSGLRRHDESLVKPRVLEALPGKLDIKRHSHSILYVNFSLSAKERRKVTK